MKKLVLAALAAFTLSACAGIPLAPKDVDAEAKKFAPAKPNESIIYVYRNEFLGTAAGMKVGMDGTHLGITRGGHFLWIKAKPGTHEITAHGEETRKLSLKTEAGKTYYVWQEVKFGMWYPNSNLQIVDDAKGRQGVLECKLIQHVQPGETVSTSKP